MKKQKIFSYKGVKVNILGIPVSTDKQSNKHQIKKRNPYHVSFQSFFREDAQKNLIVMYDIPDYLKKERDWFRRHLIRFGYVMIQRSVWVGPSPLPKQFLNYLNEIKIGNRFKTFKLEKSYNPSISAIA